MMLHFVVAASLIRKSGTLLSQTSLICESDDALIAVTTSYILRRRRGYVLRQFLVAASFFFFFVIIDRIFDAVQETDH